MLTVPTPLVWGLYVGGDLLSHTLPGAVPSALEGLASGFGKGPGVSHSAITTDTTINLFTCARYCVGVDRTPPAPTPPGVPGVRGWLCVQGHTVDANTPLRTPQHGKECGGLSPRPISTGQLHPSQGFHPRPINPVVFWGPYPRPNTHPKGRIGGGGRPHLGTSFPLRCLQRLSLPNIANQPCPWRDNWHTRGPSVPVLSY